MVHVQNTEQIHVELMEASSCQSEKMDGDKFSSCSCRLILAIAKVLQILGATIFLLCCGAKLR
jgi:hypothetical protein